jgi:hypothetical protein
VFTAAGGTTFEKIQDSLWDEAAAHRQHIAIAVAMLMAAEETQRLHEVKVLSGPRHRDVQQTALFLDLLGVPDRHVRRNAAVGDVEHKHGIPFLPFRRMDCRQHEVVFVEMRLVRLGTGGLGRIKGQLGQEGASRGIGSRMPPASLARWPYRGQAGDRCAGRMQSWCLAAPARSVYVTTSGSSQFGGAGVGGAQIGASIGTADPKPLCPCFVIL